MQEFRELFKHLLCYLRSLSLYYQMSHWQVRHSLFFQDHLLCERLYKETNKEIDHLAEKGVGLVGDLIVNLGDHLKDVFEKVREFPEEAEHNKVYFETALNLETEFQGYLEDCSKAEGVTFGFKNMVGNLQDSSENRSYLLKRRLNIDNDSEGGNNPDEDEE